MSRADALSHATAGETEPLLGTTSDNQTSRRRSGIWLPLPQSLPLPALPKVAPRGRGIVNLLSGAMLLAACSAGFLILPHTRILEDILCHDYYGVDGPIDELLCKVDPVQSRLTAITGLKVGLEALVSLFAALPWGIAADSIGRRPVFALALTGVILNAAWVTAVFWFNKVLPVRLMLLGSASPLLGGGDAVLVGVLFSMVTDVTTEAERSLCFLRIHVATMCGFLLSPTLSSLMMERTGTPWYNIIVGCGLLSLGAASIFFVPETLQSKPIITITPPSSVDDISGGSGSSSSSTTNIDTNNPGCSDQDKPPPTSTTTTTGGLWRDVLARTRRRLAESLSIFGASSRYSSRRPLMLLLLVCLAYMPVLNSTVSLMTPFMSRRFSMTIARTGYVQTVYGVMQIVQSLVVLPWIMNKTVVDKDDAATATHPHDNGHVNGASNSASPPRPRHRGPLRLFSLLIPTFRTNQHRDLALAKVSFALLLLGSLVLAAAPTLPVFIAGLLLLALGTGYASLVRSLMSLYVAPSAASRLFSVAGLVETLGGVYSSPLLSALFAAGMRLGGAWVGLPWLGMAVFMAVCIGLLMLLRLPDEEAVVMVGGAGEDGVDGEQSSHRGR